MKFNMQESGIDLALASNALDLLEVQQANEQKRLLQRFKELRLWQQQQQAQLMLQQQQQLKAWQEEQSKVQTLIATQHGVASWNHGVRQSPAITPPIKSNHFTESPTTITDSTDASLMQTGGISEDSGMASMQNTLKSQGTLPKPIMYVDPSQMYNLNDEDRYTSSELFSNPGSHEDQLDILKEDRSAAIPDWASDSSDNFVPLRLPPPRPLKDGVRNGGLSSQLAGLDHLLSTVPAGILQQVLNMFPDKGRSESPSMTVNDVELSASPTLPEPGLQSRARKLHFIPPEQPVNDSVQHPPKPLFQFSKVNSETEEDAAYIPRAFTLKEGCVNSQNFSRISEENEENIWEEEFEEENYSDNEYGENNVTAKEVRPDDRPIKGVGNTKSFEQLLEEKLREEEEEKASKNSQQNGQARSRNVQIKSFLKSRKGQLKSSNVKQVQATKARSNKQERPSTSGSAHLKADINCHQGPANLNLIKNAANRKLEENKLKLRNVAQTIQNPEINHTNQIRQSLLGSLGRSPSLESKSIPGDGDTTELDSLAEFELLEDAVDNISFCSNSSLIKKLIANDRQTQKEAIKRIKLKSERVIGKTDDDVDDNDDTLKYITDEEDDVGLNTINNNEIQREVTLAISAKLSSDHLQTDEHEDILNSAENNAPVTNCGLSSNLTEESRSTYQPQSPSKFITRKIAPLTSRFNTALDTLSMLKVLSHQAGILTSSGSVNSSNGIKSFSPLLSSQSTSQPEVDPERNKTACDPYPSIHPDFSCNVLPTGTEHLSEQSLPNVVRTQGQPSMLLQISSAKQQFSSLPSLDIQKSSLQNNTEDMTKMTSLKSYDSHRYGVLDTDDDDSSDYNHYEESDGDDSSVISNVDKEDDCEEKSSMVKPPQDKVPSFDDESSWIDDSCNEAETCIKPLATSAALKTDPVHSTPPTSKLVSRLFPKLKPKPKPQEEKNNQILQLAASQPPQSEGVQSKILRDKLKELEIEIEKFRSENANLEKLRREREEGLAKLKQEIENFQKEKENELKRLEEFKAEEMKKLRKERKLFDSYQKKIRSMPDKKDREEIEMLRNQLQELQDELKRKENRWNSSTARLKDRLAELELENGELKEEVRILEKKRLEWMTSQSKVNQAQTNGKVSASEHGKSFNPSPRMSTPTKEIVGIKSAYSLVNNKESSTQAVHSAKATSTSTTTNSKAAGSKKKNTAMTNSHISTNFESSVPGQSSKSAGPKLRISQESVSGENMPAQKTSIPVMMDNTLPNTPQISSDVPVDENYPEPLPVMKSAAKIAMEKAVVDKGDITSFKESRHPEGKVEKTFKTGAKEIYFPNGTVKEISADGQTIICRLANGDVRQIFPDHRVVYIFAESEILQTTYPDGLETFEFKNGQTEKRYPDGTVEIIFPSKDVKYLFPDGGQEVILTNGTVMQYNSKGERTVEYPSGDREIHTAEYQRREFPDGIIKTVYADGRHETRFPNGRVRLRDKAGNVIIDQIVYR